MNDEIQFVESSHKYFRNGDEYISVTTLIHRYVNEFDSGYWSTYKAVKDVYQARKKFSALKRQVGGWENVVDAFEEGVCDKYMEFILPIKKHYLAMWEKEGAEASEKGTAVHKRFEDGLNNGEGPEGYVPYSGPVSNSLLLPERGVVAEAKVFNDHYKIAGQVDKTVKAGKDLYLTDHKTYKKVDTEGFREATMLWPLDHLPDCNYSHACLQLSLYGWMYSQFGYTVQGLYMHHCDRDTGKTIKVYQLPYLEDEVTDMLEHYKNSIYA